ncbi:TetR/AcrR family transcriptional regulator [Sediminispirochaeta bajacaliforniensis]|uniref:TetR/AcrR family transcriptional regulator n=1 Tax=Sediminispirochaeta bajacaliforniensis TaxID=148 RepID=UPI00035F6CC9|nr:TetR/AcrR family transcriptional regulator [Sediminispirochaeta bajacaliforniensis]
MKQDDTVTRQRILVSGKEEFLEKGFVHASLRTIAKNAGVTTGAIYLYYENKEALFNALVAEPVQMLLGEYRRVQDEFASRSPQQQLNVMHEISEACLEWMIDHIYEHYDAFKLVVCCSTGTRYAAFIEQMVEIEVRSSYNFFEIMEEMGKKVRPMDDELIHILASALFSGFFEIVVHDMNKEKAKEYVACLMEFYEAGWDRLLGL